MIIKDINRKISNTPDNINEELAPISEEYIKSLFEGLSGDESNPLDYYTKMQIDTKVQNINANISLINSKISTVEESVNLDISELENGVNSLENGLSSASGKITTLENKVSTMKNITYSTVEPTDEEGIDGDLWIIYEE